MNASKAVKVLPRSPLHALISAHDGRYGLMIARFSGGPPQMINTA